MVIFLGTISCLLKAQHFHNFSSGKYNDLMAFSADEIKLIHEDVLGTGSFATVYKGKMAHRGPDVAVKVLRVITAANT